MLDRKRSEEHTKKLQREHKNKNKQKQKTKMTKRKEHLLPSGNPFKCHEEVLYFQLLILKVTHTPHGSNQILGPSDIITNGPIMLPPSGKKPIFILLSYKLYFIVAPVAQRYHVTSDTLGREFDPSKRDFSH